jgi:hypothetical protein
MEQVRALAPSRARLLPILRATTGLALLGVLGVPSCMEIDQRVGVAPATPLLNVSEGDAELTTDRIGAPSSYTDGASASSSSAGLAASSLGPLFSVSVVAPSADPRSVVRIYKDHDAWRSVSDGGRDEASLGSMGKAKGVDYFVHPMSSLGSGIPAGTRAVIITANSLGDPATSATQRSEAAQQALVAFLQGGGTLVVDLADNQLDNGYEVPGASGTPSYLIPPRAVCFDATLAPAAFGNDATAGTADDHRFVRGADGVLGTADDFDNVRIDLATGGSDQQDEDHQQTEPLSKVGCSVAHGNLEDGFTLPGRARVLATAGFATAGSQIVQQRAVLAEYCHAGGRVIVNTFTNGFFDHKPREGASVPLRMSHIQKSLFSYALSAETYCNKAPTIMAPANIEVATDAGVCSATILDVGEPDIVDDAAGVTFEGVRSDNQPLSAPYPKDETTITWTTTDVAGETARATQVISVKDREKPAIAAPADVTVNTDPGLPSAAVDVGYASATDNCSSEGPVTIAFVRSDGADALNAPYYAGPTTVTWTATDGSGNVATAVQTITVNDAEAPVVTVPANKIVSATMPRGANVTYVTTATDNVGVTSLLCSPASGTWFPMGLNTVTCTAVDAAGNSTSGSFTVKVLGAPEQIVALIEYVKGAMINSPQREYLLSFLTKVLADPRSTPYACSSLDFFIAAVKLRRGTAIPIAKADRMIADARRIKSVLACP